MRAARNSKGEPAPECITASCVRLGYQFGPPVSPDRLCVGGDFAYNEAERVCHCPADETLQKLNYRGRDTLKQFDHPENVRGADTTPQSEASPRLVSLLLRHARGEYIKWGGTIALAVGLTIPIVLYRDQISEFSQYGYPGLFVFAFLASALLFLGAPVFALAIAAGAALNPIAVGLVAGLGSALGELTGYLAGFGGNSVLQRQPFYAQFEGWMQQRGTLAVFLLGLIPNPIFDVAGVIAGAVRMPLWKFVLAGWVGKSLRLIVLAYGGHLLLGGDLLQLLFRAGK